LIDYVGKGGVVKDFLAPAAAKHLLELAGSALDSRSVL
jgi:hypothetical protein